MPAVSDYELLDFGAGRKLERFGRYVLDRPAPAAERFAPQNRSSWRTAHARYDREPKNSGRWTPDNVLPETWTVRHGGLSFAVRPTPFGHLGLFAEQAPNWSWIAERVRALPAPPKVLNLFAYTGGSTLAAVRAGARVVHVDAAANVVRWARQNAELSGLTDAPIRWITEDTMRFVGSELKRGNRYDAVILDPPSYGHGPKREVWKIESDFESLLAACVELGRDALEFMLVTCHTEDYGPARVARLLSEALGVNTGRALQAEPLKIASSAGRELHCGVAGRWSAES